ncbi:MAG: DinB family protein [Candidatus Omnitrophica bacterium]|nr:DinB family protein [Candidatus Omnitrophota bacterium]MCA9443235.1 DinB family protein [Candidatus Omnitrophota bacterium]
MTVQEHLKASFALPDFMMEHYLMDLSDEDLMVRPLPVINHFKWQLGHLVQGEHSHMNELKFRRMPELPEGFADLFTKETAKIDDPAFFPSKESLVETMTEQRKGTLQILDGLSESDLESETPEAIRYFGPKVGNVFSGEVIHWMLHVGQLTVLRKYLGKQTF